MVGGAGYIGGLVTDLLLERGYEVMVYDRLLYEPRYLKDCRFVYGDVRDTDKVVGLQGSFDEVVWLAAIVGDGACAQNPELTLEVNTNALKRFLERVRRRVIFASTCSVYGARDELLTEESETAPMSVYAASKLLAEEPVLRNGGLVLRLGTLYGLGDKFSRIRLDLVVNVMTLRALREGKLTVFGGDQWRPIIAVRDVAEYFAEAVMRSNLAGVFNVKYENMKMIDLAELIKRVFPEVKIEATERKFEDLRNYRVSDKKVRENFTFVPRMTVEAEVRRMKQMLEERRIKNVDDEVYYNTHYVKILLDNHEL